MEDYVQSTDVAAMQSMSDLPLVVSFAELRIFRAVSEWGTGVAFSPDGTRIVSGFRDTGSLCPFALHHVLGTWNILNIY
jgi:hypothetical protein